MIKKNNAIYRHAISRSIAIASIFLLSSLTFGQSLDEVLEFLLDANCEGLSPQSTPEDPDDFGRNLIAICEVPTTSNAASAGGGAATAQGAATSIQNNLIQNRLERARGEQRGDGEAETANYLKSDEYQRSWRAAMNSVNAMEVDAGEGSETDFRAKKFDLFFAGGFESLDRDVTAFEDGYESSVNRATIGADYRFNDKVVAGIVASFVNQDGDFEGGGQYEVQSIDPRVFVSILTSPTTFLQFVAGHRSQDHDVERFVNFTIDRPAGDPNQITQLTGLALSKTDSSATSGALLFGYDRAVRNYTFGPRVGASYKRATIDSFVENGGTGIELRVSEQTVTSLQSTLGFYAGAALGGRSGQYIAHFNAEYIHEFEDERDLIGAQLAEDLRGPSATTFFYQASDPDADFVNLEFGISAIFPRGIQPYLTLRSMVGNSQFDSISGALGVRFEI